MLELDCPDVNVFHIVVWHWGVVLISSELPEIMGMTDRVAVFHEGQIAGVLETRKTNQEEIMHYASGRIAHA